MTRRGNKRVYGRSYEELIKDKIKVVEANIAKTTDPERYTNMQSYLCMLKASITPEMKEIRRKVANLPNAYEE